MDQGFPEVRHELALFSRQGETTSEELPLFDQHVALLSSLPASYWIMPIGITAVGLYYRDSITEYVDLVFGLLSNIANSVLGNWNPKFCAIEYKNVGEGFCSNFNSTF